MNSVMRLCRPRLNQLVLLVLLVGWAISSAVAVRSSRLPRLQVDLKASAKGKAQLYWSHGSGFKEKLSESIQVPGANRGVRIEFNLPTGTIDGLRLDPVDVPGTVTLEGLRFVDGDGDLIHDIPLSSLVVIANLKLVEHSAAGAVYRTDGPATEAAFMIALDYPLRPRGAMEWGRAVATVAKLFAAWFGLWLGAAGVQRFFPVTTRRLRAWCGTQLGREYPVAIIVGMAFAVVVCIAAYSRPNTHPDEGGHVKAAEVYDRRWLPVALHEPEMVDSMMKRWGYSYLSQIDKVYWLAPKLTAWLPLAPTQRLRAFNASLLAALFLVAVAGWPQRRCMLLFLCATPQLWYLFCYFNGDAFPLAASFLVAAQLADPSSGIRTFVADPSGKHSRRGALGWGVLCGLIVLSKTNYLLVVVFSVLTIAIRAVAASSRWTTGARRVGVPIMAAAAIACPVLIHDAAINGFEKGVRADRFVEAHAAPAFRPSNARSPISYPPLFLKAKGYPLTAVVTEFDWVGTSVRSFFGVYGYMTLYARPVFYSIISSVFCLVVGGLSVVSLARGSRVDRALLVMTWCFMALAVGQSLYYSWVAGFQPQGRYLMPVLPMLMVGVARAVEVLPVWLTNAGTLLLGGLSVWSLLAVAVPGLIV